MNKAKWISQNLPDQLGRVVIVTGANSGIGFDAAGLLAFRGATVVLACRSERRGAEAAMLINDVIGEGPGSAEFFKLDLSSLASVSHFVEQFMFSHQQLDLLINNAGVMIPPLTRTAEGFELQFGVNHLGHFALTGQLLKTLLKTEGSRIVNVASQAHRAGKIDFDDLHWEKREYSRMKSYGQSKLANLLFTYELQRRLLACGATTTCCAAHPGWTRTNLQRHSGFIDIVGRVLAMPPWKGALPTLLAANAQSNGGKYYGPGGFMQLFGYPKQVESNEESHNEEIAKRLWEVSEELTKTKFDFSV